MTKDEYIVGQEERCWCKDCNDKVDVRLDENEPKLYMTYDEVVAKSLEKINGWEELSDHDKKEVSGFAKKLVMAKELKLRDEIIRNPEPEDTSEWVVYEVFYEWRDNFPFQEVEEVVAFCPSLEVACNLAELLEKQEQELQKRLERDMNKDGYYSGHACKSLECSNYYVGLYQP